MLKSVGKEILFDGTLASAQDPGVHVSFLF